MPRKSCLKVLLSIVRYVWSPPLPNVDDPCPTSLRKGAPVTGCKAVYVPGMRQLQPIGQRLCRVYMGFCHTEGKGAYTSRTNEDDAWYGTIWDETLTTYICATAVHQP